MEHVDLALGGCLSRRFSSQASSRRLLVRSAGGGVRDCSLRLSRLLSSACSSACRSWMLENDGAFCSTPARALLVVVTNGRAVRCVSCSSRGQPGAPMKNGRRSATNLQQPSSAACLLLVNSGIKQPANAPFAPSHVRARARRPKVGPASLATSLLAAALAALPCLILTLSLPPRMPMPNVALIHQRGLLRPARW